LALFSVTDTKQLGYWRGPFGDAYIDRNDGDMHARRPPFFQELLDRIGRIRSVCEIGCNVAWNLKIISDLRPDLVIHGIEPNERALSIARDRYPEFDLMGATAFELPFGNAAIDLLMTVNVLIHIAPADL
jgi:spore coat polysaccharide biosynthesis protein SpsF